MSTDASGPVPVIVPAWPAPARVTACFTTRQGGISTGPWGDARGRGGLNLGGNCGDEPQRVAANRRRIGEQIGMPIRWLDQVHGTRVSEVAGAAETAGSIGNAGDTSDTGDTGDTGDARDDEKAENAGIGGAAGTTSAFAPPDKADAQVTRVVGVALAVLVADCLPVLLADRGGTIVGVAHAGWRGLAAGVVENTVALMRLRSPGADLVAWLGPCIGPAAFEVGEDVVRAFVSRDPAAASLFVAAESHGKWLADLRGLATQRLQGMGVSSITRTDACTVADPENFWSYRRDGAGGRMAGIIALRH